MYRMNSAAKNFRQLVMVVVLLLFVAEIPLLAQDGGGIVGAVVTIKNTLVRFLKFVIAIFGLVSLTLAINDFIHGKTESAKRLILVAVALTVSFLCISFIGSRHGALRGAGGGDFAGMAGMVGQFAFTIVIIAGMISIARIAVDVMKGDKESVYKFFRWLIVMTVGLTVLS